MATHDSILEVVEVNKAYGAVEVLHGLNLTVGVGERVALTGPSGSGKSTLLNCLCGIEPVDSGQIKIAGESLQHRSRTSLDRLRRDYIGYVFQSVHLLPTLTAIENIELPGQLIGMDKSERI